MDYAPKVREVELEAPLDHWTAGMQVGGIVEELLQPLYDLGATAVELTFIAFAEMSDGIDDGTQRVLNENAAALENAYGVRVTIRVR